MNMAGKLFGGILLVIMILSLILSGCGASGMVASAPNPALSTSAAPTQSANPPQSTTSKAPVSSAAVKTTVKDSGATMTLITDKAPIAGGDSFEINVKLDTKNQSRGAQCGLSFDPAVLQCTGVVEGTFYKDWADENDCTTIVNPAKPNIDNDKGTIAPVGVAVMGQSDAILAGKDADGVMGSGIFLVLKMTAKPGVNKKAAVNLVQPLVFDPNGTSLGSVSTKNLDITVGNP